MKSLISLSILTACFVACQPSKAPEQKQTSSATAIDTLTAENTAVSGVMKENPPPPEPPKAKNFEFVHPTIVETEMPEDKIMDFKTEKTQGQYDDVPMEVDDRNYNPIISYENAEQKPEFNPKGGLETYIKDNLIYPEEAMEKGISGVSIVAFDIDQTGRATNIRILKSSGNPMLDAEAMRVIRKMPNWIPGKVNGRNVSVMQKVPVVFELGE
jgi:protein TonB